MTRRLPVLRKAAPLAVALLMLVLVQSPAAQSFCSSVIPSGNLLSTGSLGSINSLLGISAVIMLLMASISGVLYAIGYSFKINGLVRASKQEFGEIAITVLIVFVLVGVFTLTVPVTQSQSQLLANTGAYSRSIFNSDCSQLTGYGLIMFQYAFDLGVTADFTKLIQGFTIKIMPINFGISFSPYSGYSISLTAVNLLFIFSGLVGGILFAGGVVLGVFYAIMPLFLFAGIVLRTLPWTRAAGGAFLGIFIGFFIVFPLILHFIVFNAPANLGPESVGVLSRGTLANLLSSFDNPGILFTLSESLLAIADPQAMVQTIVTVLVPAMYGVFAFIFSFIIAFDFSEVMGDFLGSPSLSTSKSLNKML